MRFYYEQAKTVIYNIRTNKKSVRTRRTMNNALNRNEDLHNILVNY